MAEMTIINNQSYNGNQESNFNREENINFSNQ
jgi:hypothetical protein